MVKIIMNQTIMGGENYTNILKKIYIFDLYFFVFVLSVMLPCLQFVLLCRILFDKT